MRQTPIYKNTRMLMVAGLLGIAGTFTSVAAGEDKLGAQALVDEAKHLMDSGKTAEACAKYESSLELDSNFTTLMSLGQCYEKVGRLASAYLTYRSAESDATASEQAKRAKTAHDRAEKIAPKMSRLTIRVTPEAAVKGLVVTRNGMNVAQSIWGTAIPVDPGAHDIVAQVGKKKWNQRVDVGGNAAQVYIDIPAFAPQPAAAAVVPVPAKAAPPVAARPVAPPPAAPRPTAAPVAPRPVAPVAVAPVAKPVAPIATAAPRVAAAPPPPAVAKPVVPVAVAPVPKAAPPVAPKAVVAAPPPAPKVAVPPPAPKVVASAPPKPVAPVAKPAPVASPPVAAPVAAPKPAPVAAAKPPEAKVSPKATETAPPLTPPEPTTPSEGGFFTQQNIGIGVASLGVVGVGLGTFFVLRSNSKENSASAHCGAAIGNPDPTQCDEVGISANDAALSARKVAIGSYVAGGVLMAGGIVLILTEPKHDQVSQLRLHPFVGENAASLSLSGRF